MEPKSLVGGYIPPLDPPLGFLFCSPIIHGHYFSWLGHSQDFLKKDVMERAMVRGVLGAQPPKKN